MTETEALSALRDQDPLTAAEAEAALWQMWGRSGRADVDAIYAEAVEALERNELDEAQSLLSRVIELAPDFAEGWNKRATTRYLAEDYEGSIRDCEETLARNPHHFGALSGQGLCHGALGEHAQAAACFMRALAVHPHLSAAQHNLAAAIEQAFRPDA